MEPGTGSGYSIFTLAPGALDLPRFGEPGSRLRVTAAAILAGATTALLLQDLFVAGWPTAESVDVALRENFGWVCFWALFWILTRKEEPARLSGARKGVLLQPRHGATTLAVAALVLLPLVVLFGLAGGTTGPAAFALAVVLVGAWYVLSRELSRSVWLTAEGIEVVSPWTRRGHLMRWSDFEAVVEERRWRRDCLTVVGPRRMVLRIAESSEGVGSFAAMCLAWLPARVLEVQPDGRRRLERLAADAAGDGR